jgi:hypothetical protein
MGALDKLVNFVKDIKKVTINISTYHFPIFLESAILCKFLPYILKGQIINCITV